MLGAGILAARGALRAGAGLVYLAVPKELKNCANLATPEVIIKSHEEIKSVNPDVIAIGPGLGQSPKISQLIHSLVKRPACPLVIDADGLNNLKKSNFSDLGHSDFGFVLTPHPGEMSRLTGLSIASIQKDRVKGAKTYAKKWNAVVVLKGHKTVVAAPTGKTYINTTGNPGMASGGVGDVLTGVIAAFIAQGFSLFDAAKAGVFVHGLAGDMAKKEKGEYGLIASDIVCHLPRAILKVTGDK